MQEFNSCADLAKNDVNTTGLTFQDLLNLQEQIQNDLAQRLPERNIKPSEIKTKGEVIDKLDRCFDSIMDEFRELKTSVGGMSNGAKVASSVWKPWKAQNVAMRSELMVDMSEDDTLEMKFEFVDILHFILDMALTLDITEEELFRLYILKNKENLKRYRENY